MPGGSATPAPRPFLCSVVVPAFREGDRLPALLDDLVREAAAAPAPATELLVVDDGSEAGHVERERAAALAADARLVAAGLPHRVRFLAAGRNAGKGAAIRRGWGDSDPGATWLGFLDADGAVSAREAWRLVRMVEHADAVDVIAGTRVLMAGRDIRRSFFRHVQGRVFATVVEALFRVGFYDTQCGVKLLRASVLRPLLPRLEEERWLLDLEILLHLQRHGARCIEVPIDWSDPGGSKLVPGVDPLRMAMGIWRIRRRLAGG